MIIPSCVYSNPQVASIGITEEEAIKFLQSKGYVISNKKKTYASKKKKHASSK